MTDAINLAEQAVVGAALLVPDRVLHLADLMPQHFYDAWLGRVWGRIQTLQQAGETINPLTVAAEAQREGVNSEEVGLTFMAQLVDSCPGAAGFAGYVSIVQRGWRDREARKIASTLQADVGGKVDPVPAAITALMALDRGDIRCEMAGKDALAAAHMSIEKAFAAEGKLMGITTGFEKLNEVMGGFQKGNLTIVQARPGIGKTAFMLALEGAAAKAGHTTGIFSCEQPAAQIAMRQLAIRSNVSLQKIRTASLDEREWSAVTEAMRSLKQESRRVYDRSSPLITSVAAQARRWAHVEKVEIIYVDYLQRLSAQGNGRQEVVGEIARGLKSLARDLDIPVVALAQSVRRVDERDNKRPQMGDIAESSECEKEADEIISLYRDEVYNDQTEHPGRAEIDLCKNRHGPTGLVYASFVKHCVKFCDYNGDVVKFRGAA